MVGLVAKWLSFWELKFERQKKVYIFGVYNSFFFSFDIFFVVVWISLVMFDDVFLWRVKERLFFLSCSNDVLRKLTLRNIIIIQ